MTFQYVAIDHVQLAAPIGCEEEARNFYGDLLGLQEVVKPEPLRRRGGAWFQSGSIHIHIGIEEPFTPAKKAHPAIRVHRIEALKDQLTKKGISIQVDDQLPGANRFYTTDPFGNRLEFLEWDETFSL